MKKKRISLNKRIDISVAIVLFKEDKDTLQKTINSFLKIPLSKKLILIDNSPTNALKSISNHPEVEYYFNKNNIGFGSAHNLAFKKLKETSKYHLILNPDVTFSKETVPNLIKQLKKDSLLAMIAPKVLFPEGRHQYSCRKYPKPKELLARRFSFFEKLFRKTVIDGEYRNQDLTQPFYAEYLTGCFHLYKTEDFIKLRGFDERYFLYMEDVDICKKIDTLGKKKLYYPQEKIYHVLKKGSSKNVKLLLVHFSSAIKYL